MDIGNPVAKAFVGSNPTPRTNLLIFFGFCGVVVEGIYWLEFAWMWALLWITCGGLFLVFRFYLDF